MKDGNKNLEMNVAKKIVMKGGVAYVEKEYARQSESEEETTRIDKENAGKVDRHSVVRPS